MKKSLLKLYGIALLAALASCKKSNDNQVTTHYVTSADSAKMLAGWWMPINYLAQPKLYFGDDHFFYQDTFKTKTGYPGFWTFKNKIVNYSPISGGNVQFRFQVTKLSNNSLTLNTVGLGTNQVYRKIKDTAGITSPPFTTVAGTGGDVGPNGDGGPAMQATITPASFITLDSKNNIYIADRFGIRKISATDGIINTIIPGKYGKLAVDQNDNLYYTASSVVYKLSAETGIKTIVAGTPNVQGYNGDGLATTHYLNSTLDIAINKQGNLIIADYYNNRIREVSATTGLMRTIAGTGDVDKGGEGIATTLAISPLRLIIDDQDNIYFSSRSGQIIRKLDPQTGITTIEVGKLYTSQNIFKTGDNGPASNAMFKNISSIAISPEGDIFVVDQYLYEVRKIDKTTKIITRFAGTGYIPSRTALSGLHVSAYAIYLPNSLTFDKAGKNLYMTTSDARLFKIGPF